jgi:pyruvate/2-oxoglutarate dehydrogenase complex dihydrolipoamide dehydrogenase (E3) component
MKQIDTDLCVIGAGSAGLTVAAGAAQMGARVVLIERAKMGGDCLNYGCVPSKALIAAAHRAQAMRGSSAFGIAPIEPQVDFAAVMDHVQGVIDAIAPHDSVERFTGLGVEVIQAQARFLDQRTVEAGGRTIRAKRFVIATGSRAGIPPIPGLLDVPYLTNETVFANRVRPEHLIVIGGGPIGMEMAQAHRRLGSRVTVLEMGQGLAKDDPELSAIVKQAVTGEGVSLREGIAIERIERDGAGVAVVLKDGARIAGSHLLVAAGRQPNIEELDLDKADIKYTKRGIDTDAGLRTSNKRVFAIGDVAGRYQFTHIAGEHGSLVIRRVLFGLPAKVNETAVPWCTFTDPELAQVGLSEAQAREKFGDAITVLRFPYAQNDRAQAERATAGLVKVVVGKGGRILGAGIVGQQAGELIHPWCLAIARGLKIGAMATPTLPYPTLGEISKRAAGAYYTAALFGPRVRALVRWKLRFTR